MKIIAAGIFIVNKEGLLLVCHPTNHGYDFWSIPKGKVEKGESFLEAAIRETSMETNLALGDMVGFETRFLGEQEYGHKRKTLFSFLYLETLDSVIDWSQLEIKCNSNVSAERGDFPEMDDYKWVEIDDARKLLHETQVNCLDTISKHVNR